MELKVLKIDAAKHVLLHAYLFWTQLLSYMVPAENRSLFVCICALLFNYYCTVVIRVAKSSQLLGKIIKFSFVGLLLCWVVLLTVVEKIESSAAAKSSSNKAACRL